MDCQRCGQACQILCKICNYRLCKKCINIHDKHQECFIEKQIKKCYLCKNQGWYDYSINRFICPYHI